MKIDVHTHAFHPKIADKVLDQLDHHYHIGMTGTGRADDLIQRLDKGAIDKAVVLCAATAPSQVIPANNWAIQLKKEEPRFIPFGTMHPDFDNIEEEFDRLEQNGITGLKFHPDFQGFRMDDPRFRKVMEIAGDRFIMLFHVGDTLPPEENPSCPIKMAKLRDDFPDPIMIAAHFGGYRQWDLAVEHLADRDVFVDTSSSIDFLSDEQCKRIFDKFDREHILFGSDYPLWDPQTEMDKLRKRLGFSDSEMEDLLSAGSVLFAD
ncbi:amidohydrolase family protein [Pseudodesulfovibrio tunisiensis]|uniref:amidohydrolase family protein n=1 Tax=Pseudodesulfovibrio tunisiensis TaxID=463192 RepID=UPI001FB378E1|nr:amidohydrolase family protein [Pseudodesulfovibrio tunisiensis]